MCAFLVSSMCPKYKFILKYRNYLILEHEENL
jgi:hypothetical protein